MAENWVELRKAAQHLGIHYTTLRRWADAGIVPCFRTPGGHRRFRLSELNDFLNRMKEDSAHSVYPAKVSAPDLPIQVGKSVLRDEPWYDRLDEVQLTAMRAEGQQLLAVLIQYASRENGGDAFLTEGQRMAEHYSQICLAVGLSLAETIRGFTIVRRGITDSVYKAGTLSGTPDSQSWRLFERMNSFLDSMLLIIVQVYENQRTT